MAAINIFAPIGTDPPPPQILTRNDHPVPPTGVVRGGVLQTNKFYANFFLGSRTCGTWTHPYSVSWVRGAGMTGSWGLSISHIRRDQLAFGPPDSPTNGAQYFINPIGIQSIILAACELGPSTELTMDSLKASSVNVNLHQSPNGNGPPVITFPLVQGMAFVTGVYRNATPLLQTSVFFNSFRPLGNAANGKSVRYEARLNDGTTWLVYLTPNDDSHLPTMALVDTSKVQGSYRFSGTIQVAKLPNSSIDGLALYDSSAGAYAIEGHISGQVTGPSGSYNISWRKGGVTSKPLLMFALPHHVRTFDSRRMHSAVKPSLRLETTTKGLATAVLSDAWTMVHNDIPYDMGFAPWSPTQRSQTNLPATAMTLINSVATAELRQDYNAQTNLNSMYFAGKALAKLASIVYAVVVLGKNESLGSSGLMTLKSTFARFVDNQQINPLVYDSCWGGAVSSGSYTTGNSGEDFGNTYYNDHHFHYGYFVYTAAIIGTLDQTWLREGSNVAWVNMLVRDYANSSTSDGYYPFSRMFDWYHGHSWAHGLYETADGKDQESSSEDVFASYALKLWGKTIGDASMEARGNMMLAIQSVSLNNYFLTAKDNGVHPLEFIPNKVVGILFENKVDHTTYFGRNVEYIQGIHMIPLSPASMYTRPRAFVQQEWNAYFSNGRADAVDGGWRGILYANLALADPQTAWRFFAQDSFDSSWLDGGASRTWYLALCAGWGGVS